LDFKKFQIFTVEPLLRYGSPYAIGPLSCLSVTVYCGQMVGWIKMKLDMEVGLGPGHIVLDGDPAHLPQKGHNPQFWPMSVVAKRLHGSRCRPRRHCVRWGPSSPPQKGGTAAPQFSTRVHRV